MVDERQLKGEINTKLTKLTAKIDLVADRFALLFSFSFSLSLSHSPHHIRVAGLQAAQQTQDMHVGGGVSARALLQSIVRIVQDNERVQQEVVDKQAQVDKMRDQVQTLLDRNQKLAEESSNYASERTQTFKENSVAHQVPPYFLSQPLSSHSIAPIGCLDGREG